MIPIFIPLSSNYNRSFAPPSLKGMVLGGLFLVMCATIPVTILGISHTNFYRTEHDVKEYVTTVERYVDEHPEHRIEIAEHIKISNKLKDSLSSTTTKLELYIIDKQCYVYYYSFMRKRSKLYEQNYQTAYN